MKSEFQPSRIQEALNQKTQLSPQAIELAQLLIIVGATALSIREDTAALDVTDIAKSGIITPIDMAAHNLVTHWHQEQELFPGAILLSEEGENTLAPAQLLNQKVLILDPIDGSRWCWRGENTLWTTTMGYVENGHVRIGITHCPGTGQTWIAEQGKDSYSLTQAGVLKRLQTSAVDQFDQAKIGFGAIMADPQSIVTIHRYLETMIYPPHNSRGFISLESTGRELALVANGSLDGYVHLDAKPWDVAAGTILIQEAGGVVTGLSTNASIFEPGIIAGANETIHNQLMSRYNQLLENE